MNQTSKGKINIKKYKLIDFDKKEHITTNELTKFCEERNLTPSNLIKVLNRERKHHKGWIIERFEK